MIVASKPMVRTQRTSAPSAHHRRELVMTVTASCESLLSDSSSRYMVAVKLGVSRDAAMSYDAHSVPSMTTPVLLLIDVQRNMLEPPTPAPSAGPVGAAIEDVLGRARNAGASVIHVRNNGSADDPDAPGTPGWELVHAVRDGEPIVDKTESDAFAGTDLAALIAPDAPGVVVGLQRGYCVPAPALAWVQ